MTDWKNRVWPVVTQLLLVLMGTVLVYLTANFIRQVHLSLQRHREVEIVEGQIAVTLEERAFLEQALQTALSEPAVEEWARSQGWVKKDQVLVVPVGGLAVPSGQEPTFPQAPRQPNSPQRAWWSRFLGGR
jgi:hypothetical protein